jgi:hypothetical protein
MTNVVVVDKHNTVVVSTEKVNTIVDTVTQPQIIYTGIMGPSGRISTMGDVDLTELVDGSVLMYSAQSSLWKSTTNLQNQTYDGGIF